jgi:hypothetical protein
MPPLFKKILFFLGVTLLFGTIVFYSIDSKTYGELLCSKTSSAASAYARLHFENCRSRLLWAESEHLSIVPRKLPFGLKINKLRTTLPVTSLLTLQPTLHVNANLYGGELLAILATSAWTSPNMDMRVSNVNLTSHPALRALGVTSGVLSVPTFNIRLTTDLHPTEAEATLNLESLSIEKNPYLMGLSIFDGRLTGTVKFKDDILKTEDLVIQSSYGSVRATIQLNQVSTSPMIDGTIKIILSIEGERTLGALIRALSNSPTNTPALASNNSFIFSIKGRLSHPVINVLPPP